MGACFVCPDRPDIPDAEILDHLRVQCADFLRATFEAGTDTLPGCEIVVSTAAPLVESPYGAHGWKCPHGVTYWIEPTSEQIADWAARGVR